MEALSVLGFLALVVGIIMLIVNAIRRKGLRTWGVVAAAGLAALVVGASLSPATRAPTQPDTSGPTARTTYKLSVTVSPAGAGSVSPSSSRYESGVQVTITGSPAADYTFDYWGGSASGTTPTTTITMDSDKSVTAHFKLAPIRITAVQLADEWNANEYAARQKYLNRTLEVTGRISTISESSGQGYIAFQLPGFFDAVHAYFAPDQKEIAMTLSRNDEVTVIGICKGKGVFTIDLKECRVVNW